MEKAGFKIFLLALALSLFAAATSHAIIEEKSSIVGSLLSVSDQPYAGITVRVLDSIFLNEVARTVTDNSGKFVIPEILPGLYLISFQSANSPAVMKRIQVLSGAPTFIDVRSVLDEEALKNHNAWDSLKWIIRTAERNPLREEHIVIADSAQAPPNPGILGAIRNFQQANNINGQVAYVNVGAGVSDTGYHHQGAQFAVHGDLERQGTWSFNGNVLDGPTPSYTASGDFQYSLSDHNIGTTFSANDLVFARYSSLIDRTRISKFIHSASPDDLPDESKLWITSVNLQDRWPIVPKMSLKYGARIDYYGYLQDSVNCSPHVQLSFEPAGAFAIRGVVYRNVSAPGNYYLQSSETSPFEHNVAFVPYTGTLDPEKTAGYELGFDSTAGEFQLSLFYHSEETTDKIATLDLSDSAINDQLQSIHPFVIFNATTLRSHGVRVDAGKRINAHMVVHATYDLRQANPVYIVEKRLYSTRQLYFMGDGTPDVFHDLKAGVEATYTPTNTHVQADWKWSSGSPMVFGRKDDDTRLTAIDVEVRQGLPVKVMPQSELELLLAVRNLLDQNRELTSNADFQRALTYGLPRTISGGVLFKF